MNYRLMHLDLMEQLDQTEERVRQEIWEYQEHLVRLAFLEFLVIQDLLDHNPIFSHSLIKFRRPKGVKKGLRLIHFHSCKLKLARLGQEGHQVGVNITEQKSSSKCC